MRASLHGLGIFPFERDLDFIEKTRTFIQKKVHKIPQ